MGFNSLCEYAENTRTASNKENLSSYQQMGKHPPADHTPAEKETCSLESETEGFAGCEKPMEEESHRLEKASEPRGSTTTHAKNATGANTPPTTTKCHFG